MVGLTFFFISVWKFPYNLIVLIFCVKDALPWPIGIQLFELELVRRAPSCPREAIELRRRGGRARGPVLRGDPHPHAHGTRLGQDHPLVQHVRRRREHDRRAPGVLPLDRREHLARLRARRQRDGDQLLERFG